MKSGLQNNAAKHESKDTIYILKEHGYITKMWFSRD